MARAAISQRPQRLLFRATGPAFWPYARFDVAGTEHVPRTGPAILAGNHRSYFDIPAIIQIMRPTGRTGRILAKKELFDLPVVGRLNTVRVCHSTAETISVVAIASARNQKCARVNHKHTT